MKATPSSGLVKAASSADGEPSTAVVDARWGTTLMRAWPPIAVVATCGILWQLSTAWGGLPAFVLPSPAGVIAAAFGTRAALIEATRITLGEVWIGLAISLVLGLGLASALAGSSIARRAVGPLLVASQTVPILAVAPLLVIWFGFGMTPKVAVVVLVCVFPIAISTAEGLTSADPGHVALLRSMGAGRIAIWRFVRLPGALPAFFSGLRIAVTYCVVAAMIGEWVGGSGGLGLYLLRSKNALATDQVFAAIFVTAAISIALYTLVIALERAALPWRQAHEGR